MNKELALKISNCLWLVALAVVVAQLGSQCANVPAASNFFNVAWFFVVIPAVLFWVYARFIAKDPEEF